MTPPDERLDSWKAIAAYLRRDERTVRRWEKTLGLPVHRVPGARGSSVFAYAEEVDAWLQSTSTAREPLASAPQHYDQTVRSARWGRWVAIMTLAAAAALASWRLMPGAAAGPMHFQVTRAGVTAADVVGTERWHHAFAADEESYLPEGMPWAAPADGAGGVFVLLSNRQRVNDRASLGGTLLSLGHDGGLRWRLQLEDQVDVGGAQYGPPWMCPNFSMQERGSERRIAVAAHHDVWWPGLAVVFNERGERTATFLNAGWIEDVHWLRSDRLLIAGYAEGHGGLVAVLDSNAMNGRSPATPGREFSCEKCGADLPLRYVTFPASELNRVTASRFNRARVVVYDDRILVRTEEYVRGDQIIDALYEFSPALEFRRASFSDRYWDLHHALELEGKLHHTRQECTERDGPRSIEIWQPSTRWKTVPLATARR